MVKNTSVKLNDDVSKGIAKIMLKEGFNFKQQSDVINLLLQRAIDSINKEGSS